MKNIRIPVKSNSKPIKYTEDAAKTEVGKAEAAKTVDATNTSS